MCKKGAPSPFGHDLRNRCFDKILPPAVLAMKSLINSPDFSGSTIFEGGRSLSPFKETSDYFPFSYKTL